MRKAFLFISFFATITVFGQTDTIYKLDGELLAVKVTEVDESSVKYVYPGESISNSVNKNSISKIHFRSGRIQEFSSTLNLKNVSSCLDWKNVQISHIESEVKGLSKIDNIGAKAKGLTTLSSLSKLQDRAYNKLKIMTAMLGGNVAWVFNQNSEEAMFGGEYSSSKTPGVTVSGVAFTTRKVQNHEINCGTYSISGVYCLKTNAYDMQQIVHKPQTLIFKEEHIITENNFKKINAKLMTVPEVREYTIIYANETSMVLSAVYSNKRGKKTYYNIFLRKQG